MVEYLCDKCGKIFKQKGHYTNHINKKNNCSETTKFNELLVKIQKIENKLEMIGNIDNIEIEMDKDLKVNKIIKKVPKEKKIPEIEEEKIIRKKLDKVPEIQEEKIIRKKSDKVPKVHEENKVIKKPNEDKVKTNIKKKKVEYKVLDLFCGCGGLTTGLEEAGLKVVCGIDVWDRAIDTYKLNHNHLSLVKDLTKFSPKNLADEEGIKDIDIVVGGPPCQGFSNAGKRNKNDPRNSLFMEFVKYIDYFKPKAFIMENVAGILSMKTENNEKCIDIIMAQLTKNYDCKYFKLNAADFKVPQKRKRVIFFGFKKELKIDITEPIKTTTNKDEVAVKHVLKPRADVDAKYYLSEKALEGIRKKKIKMELKGFGFGAQILDLDEPCYTIPARYHKDGYDALVKYDDTHVRRLTEFELQKIQSFPDDYQFAGSKKEVIMQIGNAVACKFATELGKYIIGKLQ